MAAFIVWVSANCFRRGNSSTLLSLLSLRVHASFGVSAACLWHGLLMLQVPAVASTRRTYAVPVVGVVARLRRLWL